MQTRETTFVSEHHQEQAEGGHAHQKIINKIYLA